MAHMPKSLSLFLVLDLLGLSPNIISDKGANKPVLPTYDLEFSVPTCVCCGYLAEPPSWRRSLLLLQSLLLEISLELLYFPTSARAQAVSNLWQTSFYQKFIFNGLFRTLTILSHRNTNRKCRSFELASKWSCCHDIPEVMNYNREDVHPRYSFQEGLVITPNRHLNEGFQKEWTQLRLERGIWPSQSSPWVLIPCYFNHVFTQKFPFNKSLALTMCS